MVRYDTKLKNLINKTVANYNAKIRRLEKINPSLALPEKTNATTIKKISQSRSEIYNNLAKLKRFSKRGSEDTIILPSGDLISKYELNELKRESARLQRNLSRRINYLSSLVPKVKGIKQDYTYAQMGDMRLNNMIAKRNELKRRTKKLLEGEKINNFIDFLTKTKNKQKYQTSIFRENYMEKMLLSQAYFIGYDQEKIKFIKEQLNKLSDTDFLKAFDEEKVFQMIRDKYPDSNEIKGNKYFEYEKEMTEIYDDLYENITKYLKDYKSYNA